ncbi:DEAD/DEAH box helicase [Crossiella sp. NPDC003009]
MSDERGFHGLFIGVDKYRDPGFTGLRFARRDAEVLHALFADTFDLDPVLLLDEDATKDRILTEVRQIVATSTASDIVVITFSGHGTRTGELATPDARVDRLAETAVPLAEFLDQIARIKAKLVIVVLDCCFSGAALTPEGLRGTTSVEHQVRVLPEPEERYTSRSSDPEVSALFRQVQGSGHIVLAASAPDERAYESPAFRHGVLTHYVLQALLGYGGTLDDGEISMLGLADYVLTNVGWHKNGIAQQSQNPMLRGTLSSVRLPVLRPGARYAKIEGTPPSPATHALSSLENHGIHTAFIETWRQSIKRLNTVQLKAINEAGVLRGEPVLVSAPTASGKTMIGELAAIKAKQDGRRTVFLLPSRALVHEQHERFHALYGPLGIKTIRATGDLRDHLPDLFRGNYDFAVLTYEKFAGLLNGRPDLLRQVGVLVVDEVQSLFDVTRGPALEALFTRLRRIRTTSTVPQLIWLSAVLGDPKGLQQWLGMDLVLSEERPVPLVEGVIGPDGQYHSHRSDNALPPKEFPEGTRLTEEVHSGLKDDLLIALVAKLLAEQRNVIVFRATRADAKKTAERLGGALDLPAAESAMAELRGGDIGAMHDQLRKCLVRGVAFHIADLSDQERQVVERTFRQEDSQLRVLVATTTLAQGVNLPADSVVISELQHPSGIPYSVSEYKNMVGRAGRTDRRGLDGTSFILTAGGNDSVSKWGNYVTAKPDARTSALLAPAQDLGTLLLNVVSAVAAGQDNCGATDVQDFLNHTLAARQARFQGTPEPFPNHQVATVLDHLVRQGFLAYSDAAPGLAPTRLGEIVVRHNLRVSSVRTVADVLSSLPPTDMTERTMLCAAQLTEELHDNRFVWKANDRGVVLRGLQKWLRESRVSPQLVDLLPGKVEPEVRGPANARRALASLLWVRGCSLNMIERAVLTTSRPNNGASDPGPVLYAMRRAADVISAVIDIASHVHPAVDLGDLPETLPVRQELGIVPGHVPLARNLDAELDRKVFVELTKAGLDHIAAILAAEDNVLLDCVGGDHAILGQLRDAARVAEAEATWPKLTDVIPPLTD